MDITIDSQYIKGLIGVFFTIRVLDDVEHPILLYRGNRIFKTDVSLPLYSLVLFIVPHEIHSFNISHYIPNVNIGILKTLVIPDLTRNSGA